jgi:DNA polymerase III alpha subunit
MSDKINLQDYTLWNDGTVEIPADKVIDFLILGVPIDKIAIDNYSPEVDQYNKISDCKLAIKEHNSKIDPSWVFPDEYKYLNVEEYLKSLTEKIANDSLLNYRIERLNIEIQLFLSRKLEYLIKLIKYIVDTLKNTNTFWGVGRGSSCSCYIFYLMGLHSVDCVLYDISITDFIK